MAFALLLALLSSPFLLPYLGRFLVQATEEPAKADIIVVLAGDKYGRRMLKAAELAQAGQSPQVLVSGPRGYYDHNEAEMAIAFAVRRGYQRDLFIEFPNDALSTSDEAAVIVPELRRRGVKRYILVTSSFHTRRAGAIFRAASQGIEMQVVASPDEHFSPEDWWRRREGRKLFLLEWLKLGAWKMGL